MANIYDAVEGSTLNGRCRVDLMDCVAQLERHSRALHKKDVTVAAEKLPQVTFMTTAAQTAKNNRRRDEAELHMYFTEKAINEERTMQAANCTYFKKFHPTFRGALPSSEPFRETRNRNELNTKEKDFAHRYAESKMNMSLEREACDEKPTQLATQAYTEAFRKYKGRDPTNKELEEVRRLWFAFANDGTVGTINKPHFYGPHSHVSICNRRYAQCPSQVYKAELPPVRGARSRFPGSIPVWSSTQNTYTMVAGDTYNPGIHRATNLGNVNA